MTESTSPRLELRGISKRYDRVSANLGIDLKVAAGEIHALLGENGAGKSTLMKIVYGVVQPDEGLILWEGSATTVQSPAQARRLGIGMVFQHFALFETLTVAENIALALDGRESARELAARIAAVSQRYGLPIDPERLVHGMSVGERQRAEIVRCLLQDPKLLIMDEPTSVLTPQAVRALIDTLRRLSEEGVSILFISHKLDEIRELCDVATVLCGGRVTGTVVPRDESAAALARLMIGSDLKECRLAPREPGPVLLELSDLSRLSEDPFGTALRHINLKVRGGEIVGIAGVAGNGQRELLAAISGESVCESPAAVRILGQEAGRLRPARRRALGLRFVPEERLGRGAVPEMHLADNCVLTGVGAGLVRRGVVQAGKARSFARATIEQFAVTCDGVLAPAESLSGGNLQKFIVGREIRFGPRVMLAAQPTWGVDVGASLRIHQALIELRDAGAAVLVLSLELEELYAICDRLAVLAQGRLSPALATATLSPETVGVWMTGAFEAERDLAHASSP